MYDLDCKKVKAGSLNVGDIFTHGGHGFWMIISKGETLFVSSVAYEIENRVKSFKDSYVFEVSDLDVLMRLEISNLPSWTHKYRATFEYEWI